MLDYAEIMSNLKEMRSRFDSGFSTSDRAYIERLYSNLLSKKVRRSGCSDCYRDAYLEIYSHLKKTGNMPKKPNYVLKAGVVIHPKGTNKFYANANIPDEVAEAHLAEFPKAIDDFLSYPADYALRVEARKNGEAPTPQDIEGLAAAYQKADEDRKQAFESVNKLTEELNATKAELEETKAALADAQTKLEAAGSEGDGGSDDGALAIEIETLKADLETANAEKEALKKELEELKAAAPKRKTAAKAAE